MAQQLGRSCGAFARALPPSKLHGLMVAMAALALAVGLTAPAAAQPAAPESAGSAPVGHNGKLLLTGGVSSIDGAAGGGLTPWAVIGSYATSSQWGATAHATNIKTGDYAMRTYGATAAYGERIEISLARQDFDTGDTGVALGLPGLHLKLDIVGIKLRVAGDAVLDSDTLMPQVAIGVEHKTLSAGDLAPTLAALGAKDKGTDAVVSATKLFLAQGVLVNLTVRATQANQNGLLGFDGTNGKGTKAFPEASVAWLLRKDLAVGAEYRAKPDNLNPSVLADALKEDDWADVFVAWAPNKHVSLTLAYVDLGHIVPGFAPKRQTGSYLSAQLAF